MLKFKIIEVVNVNYSDHNKVVVFLVLIQFSSAVLQFLEILNFWWPFHSHTNSLLDILDHDVIVFFGLVDKITCFNLFNPAKRSQLQKSTGNQNSGGHADARAPLTSSQWNGSENAWEVLSAAELDDTSHAEEEQEVGVVHERLEHVEVSGTYLAAVNHIEHLQQHENVENVGQVTGLGLRPLIKFIVVIKFVGCFSVKVAGWHWHEC